MKTLIWIESSCTCNTINLYTNFVIILVSINSRISVILCHILVTWSISIQKLSLQLVLIQALNYYNLLLWWHVFSYLVFIFHCLTLTELLFCLFEMASLWKVLFSPTDLSLLITSLFSLTQKHYLNQYLIKIINSLLFYCIFMVISCSKINLTVLIITSAKSSYILLERIPNCITTSQF